MNRLELYTSSNSDDSLYTTTTTTPLNRGDAEERGRPRTRSSRSPQKISVTPPCAAAAARGSSPQPSPDDRAAPRRVDCRLHSELRRRGMPFHHSDRKLRLLAHTTNSRAPRAASSRDVFSWLNPPISLLAPTPSPTSGHGQRLAPRARRTSRRGLTCPASHQLRHPGCHALLFFLPGLSTPVEYGGCTSPG